MKQYFLILSLVVNVIILILLIYFIDSTNKKEKELYCRDIAHEAVFRELIRNSTITDDSYTENYYYAYNNCEKYRSNIKK